jgi:membrane-bound ClpP family serine protease
MIIWAEWEYDRLMGIVITLIIVGIVLLIFGVAVKAAMFLLWIGIILLVVGAIMWVMRSVRNRA